jgi:hypothetical protein
MPARDAHKGQPTVVSSPRLHIRSARPLLALALALGLSSVAACGAATGPQLKVLGLEQQRRIEPRPQVVLYVEVVNPASRPMRLQKLQYTFAPTGATPSHGEVPLTRVIDAGAAVVVEVPVSYDRAEVEPGEPMILRGKLFAELDRIERTYSVSAEVPAPADPPAP